MKSFKLDSDNNMIVGADLFLIDDIDALVQDTKNRLAMIGGEYPFNINEGIDYITYMQNNDNNGLLNKIQERILEDNRINNVTFDINKTNNNLIIKIVSKNMQEGKIEL